MSNVIHNPKMLQSTNLTSHMKEDPSPPKPNLGTKNYLKIIGTI